MAQKKTTGGAGDFAAGVGVAAALAAAAAGAYFLYGTSEGPARRKVIKGWALKAKGEVLEKMENLKEVNEESYQKIVDTVMKRYEGLKNVDATEVTALVAELKKHWKGIKQQMEGKKKPASKKSAAKKAAK